MPTIDWRQALVLDPEQRLTGGLKLKRTAGLVGQDAPFSASTVPVQIVASALKIQNASWPSVRHKKCYLSIVQLKNRKHLIIVLLLY
eukprot:SAG31_NODE_71_length_28115_cov_4.128105_17_plen_87_part_00